MKDEHTPEECVARLKLLAEPTRLKVVRLLWERPRRVGELQAEIEIPQSLLSHHLRVLREAGFVVAERDGKGVRYELSGKVSVSGNREVIDLGCCTLSF